MAFLLLNPNVVAARNDMMTTGIVYMPVGLAYAAAALREAGVDVDVVDTFGAAPRRLRTRGELVHWGLPPEEALAARREPEGIFVYAINLLSHDATLELIRAAKARFPRTPLIVLENSQAVTAYALAEVADELYAAGADLLLTGDLEARVRATAEAIRAGTFPASLEPLTGVYTLGAGRPAARETQAPADLFPAWDLFPLESYWSLRFAHGPLTGDRYLPLLSSRGCPYGCRFCVVPRTNARAWRPRPADHVVDEMEHFVRTLGVREFHFEDLNPTVSDARIREICRGVVSRGLDVTWKLAAGTKVETIRDEETVALMAAAGCRYISISPESGSASLMEAIDKPFDVEHACRIIAACSRHRIRTQACFILGFPGETDDDRAATEALVVRLTRAGIDEISVFIVTPVPGSAIADELTGYRSLSELHFSPKWRPDYPALNRFRLRLYRRFLVEKARRHPRRILRQPLLFLRRRFETKMEMTPYRWLDTRARLASEDVREALANVRARLAGVQRRSR